MSAVVGRRKKMIVSLAVLLVAAVISSIIASFIPRFSINYLSIIIGGLIGLIIPLNHLVAPFKSEIFMYIVAPLIYFEGQTTRINLIGQGVRRIIEMTVLLVVVGMTLAGLSLTMLGIPLAFAFLMGALSTPTDATATESVSEGLIVPQRQETLLKMEALFNDASGIILVSATALWVENGYLNYRQTGIEFLRSALGGIVVGILAAILMISFRQLINRYNSSATNAQNMIFIIAPFFIYFIAEELHVSGIIAVVCAGLMQNSESARSRFITSRQYHNGIVLMNLMREVLNNIVFVILGILIIRIVQADLINGNPNWKWVAIGAILYLANVVVRYGYGLMIKLGWKGSLVFALGGVHGAVTLALVYTVAKRVTDSQFDVLVLAETLMIILSMVVPSIVFRFILKRDISVKEVKEETKRLRKEMVAQGEQAIEKIYLPADIRESVLYDIRDQNAANSFKEFWQQWAQASRRVECAPEERELEQRALLWAFRAERQYLDMVSQKENLRQYVYELYNDVLLAESIVIDPDNNITKK
jgi:CPA1 family monovalent cation:H+ antiporter